MADLDEALERVVTAEAERDAAIRDKEQAERYVVTAEAERDAAIRDKEQAERYEVNTGRWNRRLRRAIAAYLRYLATGESDSKTSMMELLQELENALNPDYHRTVSDGESSQADNADSMVVLALRPSGLLERAEAAESELAAAIRDKEEAERERDDEIENRWKHEQALAAAIRERDEARAYAESSGATDDLTPDSQKWWDEWLSLFANRDEVADYYAGLLTDYKPDSWNGYRYINAAILRRWSPYGLHYIKERAWKINAANP